MTWQGWIEPVRVLGKCGGYDSDILAGMAWAAGMSVSGVPPNPYPARIVNMSLGEVGSCQAFPAYQQMIDELAAAGVLVVVSAGNEGGPVDVPANCAGVVGVAGLRQVGTKVGYSSLGPEIALERPGGQLRQHRCGSTLPLLDRHDDEQRHHGPRDQHLHGREQLQCRHELLRTDRLRHCGSHAVG